jgi:predicted ABC-class ATPase
MLDTNSLQKKLESIDGQDYGAYQSILGEYDFTAFRLLINQIPKDPYAPPHTGLYHIRVNRHDDHIIDQKVETRIQEIAFRDFLARLFYAASENISKQRRGTGYSGVITINPPGQAILERNCVVIARDTIEIRCFLGLPASGRKINSKVAKEMLFEELPEIVDLSLFESNIDKQALQKHIETTEDSEFLRQQLNSSAIVAFIADGSILPRESGTSDRPLNKEAAIPFQSPKSLSVEYNLPHSGKICGMGIPAGVTLIVGGGYHGKSTVLKTIESGIYNTIPADGRERCVSLPNTVKIRAYGGRYIINTDISPFIRNLPFKKDTTSFCSENASGSTSQAASIMEALEVGAQVLLMDEDTCATNFMIRDKKMQQLVQKADEPITTFIDKVKQLYSEKNISTIIVLGGAGDYFDVSDAVIQMIKYVPFDVTAKAQEISQADPVKRTIEDEDYPFNIRNRVPVADSIDPTNQYGKRSVYSTEIQQLVFGKNKIDLTDLEQLCELSQTKAIGSALEYAREYMHEELTLKEIIIKVMQDIENEGLDVLSKQLTGHFAWFRGLELAFTMNRLRSFNAKQK